MNDTQFTQLMALLEKAGSGASDAFLWWLLIDRGVPYIALLTAVVVVVFASIKIVRILKEPEETSKFNAAYLAVGSWWCNTYGDDKGISYDIYNRMSDYKAKRDGLK